MIYNVALNNVNDSKFTIELPIINNIDKLFTSEIEREIVLEMDNQDCTGILICGDEPFSDNNKEFVCSFIRTLKAIYGNTKIINVKTSLSYDSINDKSLNDVHIKEIIEYASLNI